MKWKTSAREAYQESYSGRAHAYYYIYRADNALWRAGRWMFNHDVDFRIDFPNPTAARYYIETYDQEVMLIEAM